MKTMLSIIIVNMLVLCNCASNGNHNPSGTQITDNFTDSIVNGLRNNNERASGIDVDREFLGALKDDRNIEIDTIRIIRIVENPMYKEESSSPENYARLMNYLFELYSEEYSESISYYLYQMFSTYPSKFSEFEYYLNKLPYEEQDEIRYHLTSILTFEFLYDHRDLTKPALRELFITTYPYLSKYENCIEEFHRQLEENDCLND